MIDLFGDFFYNKPIPLIVQIGVGGTGSQLSQQVAQMLSTSKKGIYVLADPDIVEEKNLRNQLFSQGNIGRPKAEILAKRYSAAYDYPVYSYTEKYIEDLVTLNEVFSLPFYHNNSYNPNVFPILIGCVDNNYTRKIFHDFFNHENVSNIVYIDAGNESVVLPDDYPSRDMRDWTEEEITTYKESGWTGQVVVGVKKSNEILLEPVADVYPDILMDDDEIAPSEMSCEDLTSSDPQRLITNRFSSMAVSTVIAEILEAGTISNHKIVFHAKRGYMRAEPVAIKEGMNQN